MDVANVLKLDITLQNLSTVVVAVHLWELKSVKNKICEAFNSEYSAGPKKRCDIFDYVIELVPLLGVPEKLSEEIKNYVCIIGGLIFDFMEHITRNGLDVAFGMNIYWTPYGRIDEVKMCRDFLKNSSEGQMLDDRFLCLARIYTDIDLVRPKMRKIRKKFKKAKNRSLDIFQHCLENDNLYFATRYFWRELDIKEKENIILNCVQKFLSLAMQEPRRYTAQVKTELLVFFMGEMSKIQLSEFITKNYTGLFVAFLKSWPYQELCGNIIDLYDNGNDDDGSKMEKYFSWILDIIQSDHKIIKYKYKNVFHNILQNLLEKSPDKIKQNYFLKLSKSISTENIFTNLAEKQIWVPLSTILNDGSLKGLRKDVVYGSQIDCLMRECALLGDFKLINNFLQRVVSTEEEIKLFKRKIYWVHEFAIEGNIKAADRALNWACDTEKERKEIKMEIHPMEICKFIMKSSYDIAEEFVNWLYETEEERKDVKKMLYALDRRDPLKFCTDLFHKKEFKVIDQYITWRYSNEEERKNIRKVLHGLGDPKEICKNLIDEIRKYDYKDSIEKARFYLKLRFETEDERQGFKKEFCKSEKYLLEKCNKVLIPMDPDCRFNFDYTDYLNCFEMLKFFLETKEAVIEFETNNIFTEEFFLKHDSVMRFKNFDEFLQFRDKMQKVIDDELIITVEDFFLLV